MITRAIRGRSLLSSLLIIAVVMGFGNNTCMTARAEDPNRFETVRAYIQRWLSKTTADDLFISPSDLKSTIVDDWVHQQDKYQIVSVRKPDDDAKAGHVPHAASIYWVGVADDSSLARLDSNKTVILYCYYGHASMLSGTILNLLGYRCRSLEFGMMGWNLSALVKEPWDQTADYEVESAGKESGRSYPRPVITSEQRDARSIIKERVRKYLSGEGSPVVASSDVKAMIDDWQRRQAEYQIVDVRSRQDYGAGHVPHSLNIPWVKVAEIESLKKLDPGKTTVVCSENGQTAQLATMVLSLLGYRAVAIKFGMMDWNSRYVDKSHLWHGAAEYPVEVREEPR